MNTNSEIYIPVIVTLSGYYYWEPKFSYAYSRNLTLIDNKWHFILRSTYFNNGIYKSGWTMLGFLTANVKIVKTNGSSGIYLENCLGLPDQEVHCVVEGENQNILDLVYLTNSTKFNASIRYDNFKFDLSINRNATLTFVKVFDYFDYTGIKILVEDDEDLPEDSTLFYDLGYRIGFAYFPNSFSNPCIFNDHILTCVLRRPNVIYRYKLASLRTRGGITWLNLKDQYIDIHRNFSFTFQNAHDLFFTDKWHFLIDFSDTKKMTDEYESFCTYLIDIVHNSEEVTTRCEMIKIYDSLDIVHCYSNYEFQKETDKIKLRKNRKYGTIAWLRDIYFTEIASAEEKRQINLIFSNA